MMENDKKAIWGWAIYDWANSAFATTVMAGFFPIFFKEFWSKGANVNVSTAQLGLGNAMASLTVALVAPILGTIADRGKAKKKFLVFFAYIGVIMTASLFLIHQGNWVLAIFIYVMGIIGFSCANVFYDALLPGIATKNKIDFVSCLGYSLGYLGGGLLFLLNAMMTLRPETFGLADSGEAVRYSFLSVALWWGGFTVITILWVPEPKVNRATIINGNMFADGFIQFIITFKKMRHMKTIFLFLVAYWLYIDGINTIIRMAVDYGLSIGLASKDLIKALLITQFVGFPAALVFGKLGERWDVRKSIFITIGVYMFVTVWGVMITNRMEFYVLASTVGLVQGGIQALSRSYYSRLIPKSHAGEFYGFYNMVGKFAAIMGPVFVSCMGLIARRVLMPESPSVEQMATVGQMASRWGIGSILILFIAGAVLFYFVEEEKGKQEAEFLERELA